MLSLHNSREEDSGSQAASDDHTLCVLLSHEAYQGAESAGTIRLLGHMQGHDLLMLIDSGSSSSFISVAAADRLQGVMPLKSHTAVKIANGGTLQSDSWIPGCEWNTQGHTFHTDLRVLELGCYDVILGMDWLSEHSPMDIHWGQKRMSFLHQGGNITLVGVSPNTSICLELSPQQLKAMQN